VPNLMIGFGIDQIQAEYVAEIKLRNINREYILKRVEETSRLEEEIADLELTLSSSRRIKKIIIDELKQVIKKYPSPRRTEIVWSGEVEEYVEEDSVEDYPVNLFLSREGYLKKITQQSLRMNAEQKYKEGDDLLWSAEAMNSEELLIFSDKQQVYKLRLRDLPDTKASALGAYLPTHLEFDEGEKVFAAVRPEKYTAQLLFVFENGKVGRVELSGYATKTNRKKLTGAYSAKSPLVAVLPLSAEAEVVMYSTDGRALVFSSALLAPKTSRDTQGVSVMSLKKNHRVSSAVFLAETPVKNLSRYRVRSLPAAGALLKEEDRGEEQMELL